MFQIMSWQSHLLFKSHYLFSYYYIYPQHNSLFTNFYTQPSPPQAYPNYLIINHLRLFALLHQHCRLDELLTFTCHDLRLLLYNTRNKFTHQTCNNNATCHIAFSYFSSWFYRQIISTILKGIFPLLFTYFGHLATFAVKIDFPYRAYEASTLWWFCFHNITNGLATFMVYLSRLGIQEKLIFSPDVVFQRDGSTCHFIMTLSNFESSSDD